MPELRQWLIERFGEPDRIRGRWFYEHGERFSNGILLLSGSTINADTDELADTTCCIDVNGGALAELDFYDRFHLCQRLATGGRVTRIDLACDLRTEHGTVGMIDLIAEACERGEMTGAKRWRMMLETNAGATSGFGVSIGVRGANGSGRYLRAYDKGLETREDVMGRWERYEVEFSGDAAAEVGADIFRAISKHEQRAYDRLWGAYDFLDNPNGSHGHKDRRTRLDWFKELIEGGQPVPTTPKRQKTNLERYASWVREQVLPTAARIALAAKQHWTEILFSLIGEDLKPRDDDEHSRTLIDEWFNGIKCPEYEEPLRWGSMLWETQGAYA